MGGIYKNNDGLVLKYGTTKAIPTTAGDFLSYGASREIEIDIDISTLTTTAALQNYVTFVPANVIVDSVTVVTTTVAATITSLSVGLLKLDTTTSISDTAFVAALPVASMSTLGETTILTGEATYAGAVVGTTTGADVGYISAKIAGSTGTGKVKVRIRYRGVPPITQ